MSVQKGLLFDYLSPSVKLRDDVLAVKPWEDVDFLPDYENVHGAELPLFTKAELYEEGKKNETLIFDIECYSNYFLIGFLSSASNKIEYFELSDDLESPLDIRKLKWVCSNFKLIGFNSNSYDVPLLQLALAGKDCKFLKKMSNRIIDDGVMGWKLLKDNKIAPIELNAIDLMEVSPGQGGLKTYGARLGVKHLQDLPFNPSLKLNTKQIEILRYYCLAKDLPTTLELYKSLASELMLREELTVAYGLDLRSKSRAQIAESLIIAGVEALNKEKIKNPTFIAGAQVEYKAPKFVKFKTEILKDLLDDFVESPYVLNDFGHLETPPSLKDRGVSLGGKLYSVGLGGLHSNESAVNYQSDSTFQLIDRDVTSFYPMLVLNQGLYPAHLGEAFLKVYREAVERRILAKGEVKELKKQESSPEKLAKISKLETEAESLKIVINSSYGKFSCKYSKLFSPELLIQTSITGQLVLLMLIEELMLNDFEVISANTDGILIKSNRTRKAEFNSIVDGWEKSTSLRTEETEYAAVYSADVSNYIAFKLNGEVKRKGRVFSSTSLETAAPNQVSIDAVISYLLQGIPFEKSVLECKDFLKFVTVARSKVGAVKVWQSGKPATFLGKNIRWYYSTKDDYPILTTSGNKIPRSDGAIPCMDLPDGMPSDLDYNWYILECDSILKKVGLF